MRGGYIVLIGILPSEPKTIIPFLKLAKVRTH
jgi:hypothetical protein